MSQTADTHYTLPTLLPSCGSNRAAVDRPRGARREETLFSSSDKTPLLEMRGVTGWCHIRWDARHQEKDVEKPKNKLQSDVITSCKHRLKELKEKQTGAS